MLNKLLLITGVIVAAMLSVVAQPGDPGGDPGGGEPVPLGGIETLLVAGGLLGIKKLMGLQNKKKAKNLL